MDGREIVSILVKSLFFPHHRYLDSIEWQLTPQGISINGEPVQYTAGSPATATRVWKTFEKEISYYSSVFFVPVELVIATICTESRGNPDAIRYEPGYTTEQSTPHRVSAGLMQTLVSTAREALDKPFINLEWLWTAEHSIEAGTAYIAKQSRFTLYDPPVVACAYNAGHVYYDSSVGNRWKMRQFPLRSSAHADRFVLWFNDCFRVFETYDVNTKGLSFYKIIKEG